jgi:hypothetical protein
MLESLLLHCFAEVVLKNTALNVTRRAHIAMTDIMLPTWCPTANTTIRPILIFGKL